MLKKVYYRGDGHPTSPLPCEQGEEEKYLTKGFTLEPPTGETPEAPLYVAPPKKPRKKRINKKGE